VGGSSTHDQSNLHKLILSIAGLASSVLLGLSPSSLSFAGIIHIYCLLSIGKESSHFSLKSRLILGMIVSLIVSNLATPWFFSGVLNDTSDNVLLSFLIWLIGSLFVHYKFIIFFVIYPFLPGYTNRFFGFYIGVLNLFLDGISVNPLGWSSGDLLLGNLYLRQAISISGSGVLDFFVGWAGAECFKLITLKEWNRNISLIACVLFFLSLFLYGYFRVGSLKSDSNESILVGVVQSQFIDENNHYELDSYASQSRMNPILDMGTIALTSLKGELDILIIPDIFYQNQKEVESDRKKILEFLSLAGELNAISRSKTHEKDLQIDSIYSALNQKEWILTKSIFDSNLFLQYLEVYLRPFEEVFKNHEYIKIYHPSKRTILDEKEIFDLWQNKTLPKSKTTIGILIESMLVEIDQNWVYYPRQNMNSPQWGIWLGDPSHWGGGLASLQISGIQSKKAILTGKDWIVSCPGGISGLVYPTGDWDDSSIKLGQKSVGVYSVSLRTSQTYVERFGPWPIYALIGFLFFVIIGFQVRFESLKVSTK
jgi:apolipoprotein N-acyltransferase